MLFLCILVWSARVVLCLGLTVLDVGVDPFCLFTLTRFVYLCVSANLLHHISDCCFVGRKAAFWFLVGKDGDFLCFFWLGWPWRIFMNWLTYLVHSVGRKDRGDWVFFVFEMGTAAIAAMFMFWSSNCRPCFLTMIVPAAGSAHVYGVIPSMASEALWWFWYVSRDKHRFVERHLYFCSWRRVEVNITLRVFSSPFIIFLTSLKSYVSWK